MQLLKLDWKAGAIVGEVHYKYLLRPSLAKPYSRVKDGEVHLPDDPKQLFQHSIDNIGDLKKAAQPTREKRRLAFTTSSARTTIFSMSKSRLGPTNPILRFRAWTSRP